VHLFARVRPQETQNGKFSLGNWLFVSAALKVISRHFVSLRVEMGSQIDETGSECRNPPEAVTCKARRAKNEAVTKRS
jgi:hypothetical protein